MNVIRAIAEAVILLDNVRSQIQTLIRLVEEDEYSMVEIRDVIQLFEKLYNIIRVIHKRYYRIIPEEVSVELQLSLEKYRRRKAEGWETVPTDYVIADLNLFESKLSEFLVELNSKIRSAL